MKRATHPVKAAASSNRARHGFTLVELLVVIAIIAILAGMLLPALGNAKARGQGVLCMNNGNQMIKSWTMYAMDNHDVLPANTDNGAYGNWLGGTMSGTGSYNDPTNFGLLNNTYSPAAGSGLKGGGPSQIGKYNNNYKICKCPADPSKWGDNGADPTGTSGGNWGPRVRSFSMNQAVGCQDTGNGTTPVTGPWLNAPGGSGYGSNQPGKPYNTYGRLSPWANPGPSDTAVLFDEDPWSINDAAIATDIPLPDYMIDWPASFHLKACGVAFGDGHSIIKHWADARTYAIQYHHNNQSASQPNNPDIEWLRIHTSGNGDGTPLPLSVAPSN